MDTIQAKDQKTCVPLFFCILFHRNIMKSTMNKLFQSARYVCLCPDYKVWWHYWHQPRLVRPSASSRAPIVFRSWTELRTFNHHDAIWVQYYINKYFQLEIPSFSLTDSGSGGCIALDKKSPIAPSFKLFIWRHKECKGVLRSSGSWYSENAS